jgi:putative ABC transport system ATP-binding protein
MRSVADNIIQLKKITKVYDTGAVQVEALRGIDLDIKKGEFVAIMGASGSGKSTLLNIISCMDRPTKGEYLLMNRDVSKLGGDELASVRNKTIGIVFQNFNLLSRTTALENVELPALYGGLSAKPRREKAMQTLKEVGLEDWWHHHPNQLSGGQQQRVAIARALINQPPILLADEPTGNLDSKTSVEILDIFQKLNAAKGITVIFVTHETDIARYAARIVSFRDGLIVKDENVSNRLWAEAVLKRNHFRKKKGGVAV